MDTLDTIALWLGRLVLIAGALAVVVILACLILSAFLPHGLLRRGWHLSAGIRYEDGKRKSVHTYGIGGKYPRWYVIRLFNADGDEVSKYRGTWWQTDRRWRDLHKGEPVAFVSESRGKDHNDGPYRPVRTGQRSEDTL